MKFLFKNLIILIPAFAAIMLSLTSAAEKAPLKTATFTWNEGAFAGAQYKITMKDDSLHWEGLKGSEKGDSATEDSVVYVDLGDNKQLITWLEKVGYTVTVIINTKNDHVDGIVSNEKEHYVLGGTIDELEK